MSLDIIEHSYTGFLLDESSYRIKKEDGAVLKQLLDIQTDEELKQHILAVQKEAYAVHPYPCILTFSFTNFKIAIHPAYKSVLQLGRQRENAIFLDLPCCVGNDSRKAAVDGYPIQNIIASDLHAEFWDIGHKLFKTTSTSYPVPFIQGDIFDPAFLQPGLPPATRSTITPSEVPSLKSVTSLTQLQHRISVIHTSYFFHIFDEKKQAEVARLFASLLSPLPGSVIFGIHIAAPENSNQRIRWSDGRQSTFAHSPSSWKELWSGESGIFKSNEVEVKVDVLENLITNAQKPFILYRHLWSVTRL